MITEYAPSLSLILPRDPAVYIAFLILIPTIQLLLWGIGRYSLDMEWWKGTSLSVAVLALGGLILPLVENNPKNFIGIYSLCAIAVWIISNFLYEPDLWQRLVLTLVAPFLGSGAWIAGIAIRKAIFNW
ncbi:hypothetical protein N9B21_01365 [Verrucomicrobiales bacterium]|nr:hypothetical protein [Verrucomicrobiales bacterium]MDA7926666.1 hypothetical protein [Verrucomicrobiales bacterium]